MKFEWRDVMQSLMAAALLAILAAAVQTYIEVKLLRNDVDRLEVYVDQLWKQK